MARTVTWRTGPTFSGAKGNQANGWTMGSNTLAIPSNHTVIRVVCAFMATIRKSGNYVDVSAEVPPHMWRLAVAGTSSSDVLHQWQQSSRISMVQAVEGAGFSNRFGSMVVCTDTAVQNFEPNWKAPAAAGQLIQWNISAVGGTTTASGQYTADYWMRVLTMSP